MEPNSYFVSPHVPYNIHNTSSLPVGHNWSPDPSYSTPVSAALYNTTATASWAHTVPAFMPWVTESSAANNEQVMRFTAPFPPDPCTSQTATSWELFNNLGTNKTNANLHLKRRGDFEDASISHKQYITEEKMAARLRELHISNNYTPPPSEAAQGACTSNPKSPTNGPVIRTLQELEALLQTNVSDSPRKGSLILAPEIKNLVEPEKLFAKTIINQVERPSMALVLWKPPHGSVQDMKTKSENSSQDTMSDSENNFVTSSFKETNNNNSSILSSISSGTSLGVNLSSSSSPISVFSSASSLPLVSSFLSSQSDESDFVMEA